MKIEELNGLSLADIARKLLEQYEVNQNSIIWEFSTDIDNELKGLKETVKAIDERIDQLDDKI